ncbi:4-(cytidine 5'-diphospho)-2-C-methyl-D-erythritol kinase [Oceanobacillus sp. HCA-5259]|uniref:4-(cytidine 5'-diphospho)-2-C-methyl-D-erythritol kinase n=1 Tax=Oceanobacillus sp. HCA-5259 TaxID=3134661 RepID=UPI0030BA70F3
MTIIEKAPAKINLSLDVLRKRETDEYHDVEMIMTTIDLADRLEFTSLEEDRIRISMESRYVPNDERNLAYRAAKLFKEKFGITKGVHIKIDKHIPVSAGLGGGSTDAAAVVRGLNRLWSLDLELADLALIAAKCGSDATFSLYGETAIARGFGEIVEKLPSPPPCWVVLAKPDIGVSTRTIFQHVKVEELTHPNNEALIRALHARDLSAICKYIGNSLEAITITLHPEVKQIKDTMKNLGAPGVLMSGTGPTVYGLVEHQEKAKKIYNGMRGFCDEVYLVRLLG